MEFRYRRREKGSCSAHAKYGAWLARHKYQIEDSEILNAIACHTTGKPEMTVLDKILYIADYIEPRRYKADNLPPRSAVWLMRILIRPCMLF